VLAEYFICEQKIINESMGKYDTYIIIVWYNNVKKLVWLCENTWSLQIKVVTIDRVTV
jgi:hypothetical protein